MNRNKPITTNMNRGAIVIMIAVSGTVLWVIQDRKIADSQRKWEQSARENAGKNPRVNAGRNHLRPFPARKPSPSQTSVRVSSPERRIPTTSTESPAAPPALVTHLAGKLADEMRLGADQRARVLPLLERYTSARYKAATELLDSTVYHYGDFSDAEGTAFSALGNHAAFHAAARNLIADTTKEIEPLLAPEAMEILKNQDSEQRANTMMLLADSEYSTWKNLLGFEGIEQKAYEVFYDLSEFRLTHPLPENFTREELVTRLADERRYLTESLTPLLDGEKAHSLLEALDALDTIPATPAHD